MCDFSKSICRYFGEAVDGGDAISYCEKMCDVGIHGRNQVRSSVVIFVVGLQEPREDYKEKGGAVRSRGSQLPCRLLASRAPRS